jgi:hypothetical protein
MILKYVVFVAVKIQIVFLFVTPCSLVGGNRLLCNNVQRNPSLESVLSRMNSFHALIPYFFKISSPIYIIIFHLCIFIHPVHAVVLSYLSLLNFIIWITFWGRVEAIKRTIKKHPLGSSDFCCVRSEIISLHIDHKHPHFTSFPWDGTWSFTPVQNWYFQGTEYFRTSLNH